MRTVLWEVDAQTDFMLSGGKLYVPGAEKIIANVNRLVEQARQGRVLLISSADAHAADDPEFHQWPPHCVKGTTGAELIPEARAARVLVIPNESDCVLPSDFRAYQQLLLEKNTLDVFDNPTTDKLLARLSASLEAGVAAAPEFLVFGVVTEYCVLHAADGLLRRGYRVRIVEDAIRSLDDQEGRTVLSDLQSRGVDLISTDGALSLVDRDPQGVAESKLGKAAGN